MIKKIITANTGVSSMRVALVTVIVMSALIVLSLVANIIISTIHGVAVEWMGIAEVIGAIAVLLTPAFGFKASQKKYERHHEEY